MPSSRYRSVFPILQNLKSVVIDSGVQEVSGLPYSDFAKSSLLLVIEFVRSCPFSDSEHIKFVCANYEKSDESLARYWELLGKKSKAVSTFRLQKTEASKLVEHVLGGSTNIETAFLSDDEKAISDIVIRVRSLNMGSVRASDVLDKDLISYIISLSPASKTYEVSECLNEVKFLIGNSRQLSKKRLEGLDLSKLLYIILVLDSPLVTKTSLNYEKLDILRAFMEDAEKRDDFDSTLSSMEFISSLGVSSSSSVDSTVDYKKLYEEKCFEVESLKKRLASFDTETESVSDSAIIGELSIPSVIVQTVLDVVDEGEDICYKPTDDELTAENFSAEQRKLLLATLARYDNNVIRQEIKSYDKETLLFLKSIIDGVDSEDVNIAVDTIQSYKNFLIDSEVNFRRWMHSLSDRIIREKENKAI